MNVDTLIERAGGVVKLAGRLRVSHTTVCDWRKSGFVPGSRAVQISRALNIPIEDVAKLIKPARPTQRAA